MIKRIFCICKKIVKHIIYSYYTVKILNFYELNLIIIEMFKYSYYIKNIDIMTIAKEICKYKR